MGPQGRTQYEKIADGQKTDKRRTRRRTRRRTKGRQEKADKKTEERTERPEHRGKDRKGRTISQEVARARGRPHGALNIREEAFDTFTNREPSRFERVEMEAAVLKDGTVDPALETVIQRADPASGRERGGRGRGDRARTVRGRARWQKRKKCFN